MKTITVNLSDTATTQEMLSAFQAAYNAEVAQYMERTTEDVENGEVEPSQIRITRFNENVYMITGFMLPDESHPTSQRIIEAMGNPPPGVIYQKGNHMAIVFTSDTGPYKNGITMEALLNICKDRLQQFNCGAYACDENDAAIYHITQAVESLNVRMERVLMERAPTPPPPLFQDTVDEINAQVNGSDATWVTGS